MPAARRGGSAIQALLNLARTRRCWYQPTLLLDRHPHSRAATLRCPPNRFGLQRDHPMPSARILFKLALIPLLFAQGTRAAAAERVELRIHNAGPEVFEHVWQGLPGAGSDHDFGRIEPGQTSAWHAFPAQLAHYRKTRIQLEEGAQLTAVIDPVRHVGAATLAPGRYTLSYRIEHGAAELSLRPEPSATRASE